MKKNLLLYFLPLGVVFVITIFILESMTSFVVVQETNEKLVETIEEQRSNYETLLKKWETDYEDLQSAYWSLYGEKEYLEVLVKQVELPVYNFTEAEITLIAECVEAEAGIGNNQSQKYITQVILNRLHSGDFPNYVEEVIYQRNNGVPQFSVAYDGSLDKYTTQEVQPETLANVYNVIVNGSDLPRYVLYFYSSKVKENWVCNLNTYTECEGTVFAYHDKGEIKDEE